MNKEQATPPGQASSSTLQFKAHVPSTDTGRLSYSATRSSAWIHSMHVVTFDIEYGQAIEYSYPTLNELNFKEQERNNICYTSFPDSNSSILGATQYHFRIKTSAFLTIDYQLKEIYTVYNDQVPPALKTDERFIYGYVHFLQRKDSTLKRGYFQKSLVILSFLPFVELFKFIVSIVGSEYFENEQLSILQSFYDRTRFWSPLPTDTVIDLNIQGLNVAFLIPNKHDKLNNLPSSSSFVAGKLKIGHQNTKLPIFCVSNNVKELKLFGQYDTTTDYGTPISLDIPHYHYEAILTAFDLDLYKIFNSLISNLQLLWEMMLTCEPLIVIAPTPDLCANFIQALTSLIYPFKFSSDYRPFFTIHDQEFKDYVGLKNVSPSALLGVTNPFFTKSLEHWPNVVHLSKMKISKSTDHLSSLAGTNSTNQGQTSKVSFADRLKLLNHHGTQNVGLCTKVKPFLQKDRKFLSTVLRSDKSNSTNRPDNIQTALIRRWLVELTQSFFMPLERFLVQLMPLHSSISPFKSPPVLPSFDQNSFLASIDMSGPNLTTSIKGDWIGLYKKFLNCPNFTVWYNERKVDIDRKLLYLHMESFLDKDLPQVMANKGEIEIIDMIIFLKSRLKVLNCMPNASQDLFKQKLSELIGMLPEDLRNFFLKEDDTS